MAVELIAVRDMLAERKGAAFVTIVAETEPTLVGGKSCPLYGRVKKISRVNGQINWLYENAVNNQRGRENQPLDSNGNIETFIAEARRWGSRLHVDNRLLPFVAHKPAAKPKKGEAKPEKAPSHKTVTMDELKATPIDELYLEMRVLKSLGYEYTIDGKPADKSEVTPYLRDNSNEGARQEVNNVVILRDYKLINLVAITIDGLTHEIAR